MYTLIEQTVTSVSDSGVRRIESKAIADYETREQGMLMFQSMVRVFGDRHGYTLIEGSMLDDVRVKIATHDAPMHRSITTRQPSTSEHIPGIITD